MMALLSFMLLCSLIGVTGWLLDKFYFSKKKR